MQMNNNKIATSSLIAHLLRLSDQVEVVKKEVQEIRHVAVSKIFKSHLDLDMWLESVENRNSLVSGQKFLFTDPNIPDLWWCGKSFQTFPLETIQVDLSPFVEKKDLVPAIRGEIQTQKRQNHGIAELDQNAQVYETQLQNVEMIKNRGVVYPTLDPQNKKIFPVFIDDIYEKYSNKGADFGYC